LDQITKELVPKINALCGGGTKKGPGTPAVEVKEVNSSYLDDSNLKFDLLCIGSSTGGPDALLKIFSSIKRKPRFPIILVQHMPPVFTTKLASTLDSRVSFDVKEAVDGEKVASGVCYVAPGNYHLTLERERSDYFIKLNQQEKVCHVRPSVDVTLNSVTDVFTGKVATFVLTGMGSDGANGAEKMVSKHPALYIQDEQSSVVWGMPGAVYRKNVGAKVLDLEAIGPFIDSLCGN
jgi:two-component system chemotaxis response regulator CheB